MITLRLGERHVEEHYARELAEALKKYEKSCDAVWFSIPYGHPTMETHSKQADKMAQAARIFRDAGIHVSMQVSNTLGHGEYMKKRDFSGLNFEGSPVQHIVGPDGTVADYCFCWRGEFFVDYLEKVLMLYSEKIKPVEVYFDDDLRSDNHAPVMYGCFCESCMQQFNQKYGSDFTRQELAYQINYGDKKWRERHIEFTIEGLYAFIKRLTKAMAAKSPDTVFGIQQAHDHNSMGPDLNFMYDSLRDASGKDPVSRPGGGNYHDKAPVSQFAKSLLLSYTNSLEPDYVRVHKAEIENLPDVVFGKSIGGTINESTLYLATGCTALTYASLMRNHEPIEWHEKMFRAFSDIRPYWERLSEVSANSLRNGIAVFRGEAPHMRTISEKDEMWSWDQIVYELDPKLFMCAIPVVHERRMAKSYLLPSEMIDFLTDNDIEYLLTQKVVTDAQAVNKLFGRGYRDRFEISLTPLDGGAYERFTNHKINGRCAGRIFSESSFFKMPMAKFAISCPCGTTQSVGELISSGSKEKIGEASVITPVKGKEKSGTWAVFGYCLWNDIISSAKQNQILNTIDYLSPLSAKLISPEQAAVCASVDPKTGKTTAFTIASASQGGTEELDIVIRNPYSDNINVMSTRHRSIEPLKENKSGNELFVTLPRLNPYEIVTVFCNR